MRERVTLGLVAACFTLSLHASEPSQNPADYERVLIPIVVSRGLPGAFGSLWTSELWVRNAGDQTAWITEGPPVCNIGCDEDHHVLFPRTTVSLPPGGRALDHPGYLVHVQRGRDIAFNLRVRDLSRADGSWGTELPVVRESELLRGDTELINIPNEDGFRVLLRVYDPSALPARSVRVRVYPVRGDSLLGERWLALDDVKLPFPVPDFPYHPGYAEVYLSETSFPGIAGHERLRIELRPEPGDFGYWAFATVTHNETQHVTTITPQ